MNTCSLAHILQGLHLWIMYLHSWLNIRLSNGEIVSPKEIEFPEKMDLLENRYEQEDLGMNYIAKGDYKNAINIFLSPFFRNLDQRTNSSLRSIKNYIIIANTLFRKSAQKGGVHPI